jgi:hypothetical protein
MAVERTSIEVIALETSNVDVGIILEFSQAIPELEIFEASPVPDTYYKTMVRTGLPSAGFRPVGRGMVRDLGTLTQRVVQCGYLDGSWSADEAFFTGSTGFNLETEQQAASLLASMKAWQQRLYNGADDIDISGGFPGLCSLFPFTDSAGVVDAGGSTRGVQNANTGALTGSSSSVYYYRTGKRDMCLAWGNNGELKAGDVFPTIKRDAEGREYNARAQTVGGWAGLQLVNHNAVVRLANLTGDTTHTLTDAWLNKARTLFCQRYGVVPDGCLMSYNSQRVLQDSRTTFNPLGNQAPIPTTDSAGVPIHATLGILDTEAILTAGATTATAAASHPVEVEGAGGVQRDPATN